MLTVHNESKLLAEIYNEVIYIMLEIITMSDVDDDDSTFFPFWYYRKNKKKCHEIIQDLLEWTEDKYIHQLDELYSYVLYHIIEYFKEEEDWVILFNDERIKKLRQVIDEIQLEEDDVGIDVNMLTEYDYFLENFFEDLDFLCVDILVNEYLAGNKMVNSFGIDLFRYKEIIPPDIFQRLVFKEKFNNQETQSEETENVNKTSCVDILAVKPKKNFYGLKFFATIIGILAGIISIVTGIITLINFLI